MLLSAFRRTAAQGKLVVAASSGRWTSVCICKARGVGKTHSMCVALDWIGLARARNSDGTLRLHALGWSRCVRPVPFLRSVTLIPRFVSI